MEERAMSRGPRAEGRTLRESFVYLATPPTLTAPEETRKAQRLHTILLALCIMVFVFVPFYLVVTPSRIWLNLFIIAASLTFFAGDLLLLVRGHLQRARRLFSAYFYIAIIIIAVAFDGVYDTALTAFFLLSGILGLVNGGRAAFRTAIYGTLGLMLVYVADWGLGGIEPPSQPAIVKMVEMSGLLLVLGLVLRMTLSDLNDALERAQDEVVERKAVEAALVEARHRLEERVAERTVALSRANRNLQTLIETNRDGVLFLTGDGRIAVINSRLPELIGVPGEAAAWQGRHIDTLVESFLRHSNIERHLVEEQIGRILQNPRTQADGELVFRDRYLHWYYSTTTVGDETPAELVVLRDVTGQRQAEQMRNDLVSTMVHDLRNPLTSMLSLLSTLTWLDSEGRERLTGRQRRYVERSMETVRQMNQLVSNILDVSRLESGQMPVQPEEVRLRQIILDTVDSQKPLAAAKQLLLVTEIPSTLPPAAADMALLERILQNLLDNAIKFTPNGGEVRVTARLEDSGNGHRDQIKIAVTDTGPGIAPELQEVLFQKFVAGDGESCGSGLGLTFCKLAVEAHGGRIAVESEVDQGTAFTFTLPAAG